jgi:putative two-component system response regulator
VGVNAELTLARILIAGDGSGNMGGLRGVLATEGFRAIAGTTDPGEALGLFRSFRPDIVLLDLHAPQLEGFALLGELRRVIPEATYLPILVFTSSPDLETRTRALELGAMDFVTEPFNTQEVVLRIANLLRTRFLHIQLEDQTRWLEQRVEERTRALEQVHLEVCDRLAMAAEFRDDATGEHTRRVGRLSKALGLAAGVDQRTCDLIGHAAPLHDVGKIAIPDDILLKPGRLDPGEFAVIQTHTTIGARLLSGGQSSVIQMAEQIARSHHEHWDGGGYPHGLAGEAIPVPARVVAVADFFDALTHARPYREAWPLGKVLETIRSEVGRHFEPLLVDAFLQLPHEAMA